MCVLLTPSLTIHLRHVPHASLKRLQGEVKTSRVHSRIQGLCLLAQGVDLLRLLPPLSLCGTVADRWWAITHHMPNLPEQAIGSESRAGVGLVCSTVARTPGSVIPKFTHWDPTFCFLKMFVMINLANQSHSGSNYVGKPARYYLS